MILFVALAVVGLYAAQTHRPDTETALYRFPMSGSNFLLAGTFGEIRHNHFHSGIDIKTGGGIGQPLFAVRDGYIYRLKVSPFGFGNAVYLRHPDGEFSVYGHMNGFTAPIEEFIYQKQYASKQYEQEIYLDEGQMPVKAGDLIGFSGNSGSSNGPHLHFEIRDPEERIMNPLHHYRPFVADHKKPEVLALAMEPITAQSRVNGQFAKLQIVPTGSEGDYRVPELVRIQGKVGLEYDALDRLDGAANSCGINFARLYLDDSLIYEFALEKFTFDDKKYINVHFDYQHFKASGRRFQRSYVEPGNELACHPRHKNRGWIELHDDQVHALRLELADYYLNTSTVRLNVQRDISPALPTYLNGGQGQRLQATFKRSVCILRLSNPVTRQINGLTVTYADGSTSLLPAAYMQDGDLVYLLDLNQSQQPVSVGDPLVGHKVNFYFRKKVYPVRDNLVEEGEMQLYLPAGCVFDSMPLHVRRLPGGSRSYTDCYEVGATDIPVFKSMVLQFQPQAGVDASRMVVARKQGSSWVYVGNDHREDGMITAAAGDFGTFCLMADSTRPNIKALNFKQGSAIPAGQKTIDIAISDEFSGIASQKILCTIDGRWELFGYDAKADKISHTIRTRSNTQHDLHIMVYDQAGNLAQETYQVVF